MEIASNKQFHSIAVILRALSVNDWWGLETSVRVGSEEIDTLGGGGFEDVAFVVGVLRRTNKSLCLFIVREHKLRCAMQITGLIALKKRKRLTTSSWFVCFYVEWRQFHKSVAIRRSVGLSDVEDAIPGLSVEPIALRSVKNRFSFLSVKGSAHDALPAHPERGVWPALARRVIGSQRGDLPPHHPHGKDV